MPHRGIEFDPTRDTVICICPPWTDPWLHPDTEIAVGFGDAHVEHDGVVVWAEDLGADMPYWTVATAERKACADPSGVWRIVLFSPLQGRVYERQSPGVWALVEVNEGFA